MKVSKAAYLKNSIPPQKKSCKQLTISNQDPNIQSPVRRIYPYLKEKQRHISHPKT
ncbi:unnamed protein product [Prunus brigantina]